MLLIACAFAATASLQLPTFVNSSMALQREPLAARLWGWAAPGANVSLTLDGNIKGTQHTPIPHTAALAAS